MLNIKHKPDDTAHHSPGNVKSLSAALPVAGHAGSTGRLALPPMVLTDVTRLDSRGHQRKTEI